MNANQLMLLLQIYTGRRDSHVGVTTVSDLGYLRGNLLIEEVVNSHQTTERGDRTIRAILTLLE